MAGRVWEERKTKLTLDDGLVDLEVCRGARQRLDVDAPLVGVEAEGLESTPLAGELNGINVFVATVVASTGVTLGVFVAHGRAESVEDGARGDILRGNEQDGLPLALDLLAHNLGDFGIEVDQGLLHELVRHGQRGQRGVATSVSGSGGEDAYGLVLV